MSKKPLILAILDGYGKSELTNGNAVHKASTPNLDKIFSDNPSTIIHASGLDVGLPDGQMGNSEVGHTNIGAGRIVYQELTRITKSITDGDFYTNEALNNACDNCLEHNSNMHVMGLLSDGGVHSHINHLFAIIELAKKKNVKNVFIHSFLDGRDVSPTSGIDFAKLLVEKVRNLEYGKIATVMGRYYAMDRDNRWERVEMAYDAIVNAKGNYSDSIITAIENSYNENVTDEFVVPTVIKSDNDFCGIKENDSVVFFNFRPDRAREITRTIVDEAFTGFERKFIKTHFVCMTQYDASMPNVDVAFKPQVLTNTLGEYLSKNNFSQLRIAETEKYAHVTFFFNGGVEKVYDGEDRILVNSPKVATYDLKPQMSAFEVTDKLLEAIDTDKYDVIILNYANCDMVGHTGDMDAAVKAVEAVDVSIGKVYDKIKEKDGIILITADHGNAEQMIDPSDNSVFTAHTTNVVPLIVSGLGDIKLKPGRLADLAPTMLDILNLEIPSEMTGESLIVK